MSQYDEVLIILENFLMLPICLSEEDLLIPYYVLNKSLFYPITVHLFLLRRKQHCSLKTEENINGANIFKVLRAQSSCLPL